MFLWLTAACHPLHIKYMLQSQTNRIPSLRTVQKPLDGQHPSGGGERCLKVLSLSSLPRQQGPCSDMTPSMEQQLRSDINQHPIWTIPLHIRVSNPEMLTPEPQSLKAFPYSVLFYIQLLLGLSQE